jgi:hypothetical protein
MKVLFIGPVFYDYHTLIKTKIEELGAEVSFFSEKKDGFLYGVLNTINKNLIFLYQRFYFWRIWQKIKNHEFSHFFLIRGYKIPNFFLKKLRDQNKGIKFVMYQWDSNKNNPYFNIIDLFDKVYTFDYGDYKKSDKLKYLQLFYTEDIEKIRMRENKIKYHFFCFNSFTIERYNSILKFADFVNKYKIKAKIFCYIPKSTYIKYRYLKFIKLNKAYLSFNTMKRNDYLQFLAESVVVVDFNHSVQTGLSMRVIETYGAGKKLLTTNKSIKDNPIFSPEWVQVLDKDCYKYDSKFSKNELFKVSDRDSLSIDNWTKQIFE